MVSTLDLESSDRSSNLGIWNCRCKDIKPSISHFERILEKKYETEKYIAYKSSRIISFRDKWKPYEELFLSG